MDDKNTNVNPSDEETVIADAEVADTADETKKPKKSDAKKLRARIEELQAEVDEKTDALELADDKYLRLMAEYDNFRRRSREEKSSVYADAVSDTIMELLPLFDNLELAAKYTAGSAEGTAKGVDMILSAVPGILAKLDISAYGAEGENFDPEIHNAVMHIEDETVGEGVIVDVFQRGYRRGDKIIRFAMVKVAN